MKLKWAHPVLFVLSFSGCATVSSTPQHMVPIKIGSTLQADRCGPMVRESATLALALAPAIIGPIVDTIGQALVDASGKSSTVVTTDARLQTYFYYYDPAADASLTLNPKARCFTVTTATRASDPPIDAKKAAFSLTFSISASRDRTAFLVQPRSLTYPAALGDRSDAVLTAAIDFSGPDGKAFGSVTIPLNAKPRKDAPYSAADFDGIESAWVSLPAISDSVKTMMATYESVGKKLESDKTLIEKPIDRKATAAQRQAAQKASDDLKATDDALFEANKKLYDQITINTPVTVHVTLTETRTYNEFLAAVGTALQAQKGAITTAATSALFPPSKTPDETSSQITKVGAYWAARYTFEQKLLAYQTSSDADKPAARAAVVAAKYSALSAAASASIAIPDGDELRTFAN